MRPWEPELEVDAERAVRMCRAQFPDRFDEEARAVVLGTGWDNRAFRIADRVGDEWVLRFPQRALAARLMETELRFLPEVAERLAGAGLALPWPRLHGEPAEDYPWNFGGYRFLPGVTACRAADAPPEQREGARRIATFLAALHGLGRTGVLAELPTRGHTISRTPAEVLERYVGRLEDLEESGAWPEELDAAEVRARLSHAPAPPANEDELCPVHGDLYARHLLVDGHGRPTAVIDWGDLHLGDPAWDLSLAWTWFAGAARARFLEAYTRPLTPALLARARHRALEYGLILTHYGEEVGDAAMRALGVGALRGSLSCSANEG